MSNVIVIIIVLIIVAAAGYYVWAFHPEWIPKFILEKISNRKTIYFTSTLPTISDTHTRADVWGNKSSPMLKMVVTNPTNMDLDFYLRVDGSSRFVKIHMSPDDLDLDKLGGEAIFSTEEFDGVWVSAVKHADHFVIYIYTRTPNNKGASEFTYDELRKFPSKFKIWWDVKGAFSGNLTSIAVDGRASPSTDFEMSEKWSEVTNALNWLK